MRLQKADLLGLVAGLGLGGAALCLVMPWIEATLVPALRPASVGQTAAPTVGSAPPVVGQIASPAPVVAVPVLAAPVVAVPVPAPLPSLAVPDLSAHPAGAAPLPAVIGPSRRPGATAKAGTGFFVADDGSLLTAAHVVSECSRTAIVSPFVQPTATDIIATDANQDIALLRAPHLHPPGILPLGRPVSHSLVVLGYPASAGPIAPAETWATLENDKLPTSAGTLADPQVMVWIEAAAVTHGFSGGPIFDPGNGAVVGIVRGTIDGEHLRLIRGMPTAGMAVGPGVARLTFFLRQEVPRFETAESSDTGNAAIEDARRATVHVICWH
jgi:S1-C subfamily serine protease